MMNFLNGKRSVLRTRFGLARCYFETILSMRRNFYDRIITHARTVLLNKPNKNTHSVRCLRYCIIVNHIFPA